MTCPALWRAVGYSARSKSIVAPAGARSRDVDPL